MRRILSVLMVVTLGALFLGISLPHKASAAFDPFSQVCESNGTGNQNATVCQDKTKPQTINDNSFYGPNGILTKGVNILALVVGIAATVMGVISGLKYVNSSGDPKAASGAKRTMIFSVVGVLVVLFARAIIMFVLNKLG